MTRWSIIALATVAILLVQKPMLAQGEEIVIIFEYGKKLYNTLGSVIEVNLWHDWVVCEFEDGFKLYNRPKRKRFRNGGQEIIDYFTIRGDGNSFYIDDTGYVRHVCLQSGPSHLIAEHGPIIRIQKIPHPPSYRGSDGKCRQNTPVNPSSEEREPGLLRRL